MPVHPHRLAVWRASKRYKVPFWLLWGIAGAESSWGQGGINIFGLKSAAEGVDVTDWDEAAMQAAKTLRGLKDTYGNWNRAVKHYSGYGYDLSWPRQLAREHGYG